MRSNVAPNAFMICRGCGTRIKDVAQFCGNCGAPADRVPRESGIILPIEQRSSNTAYSEEEPADDDPVTEIISIEPAQNAKRAPVLPRVQKTLVNRIQSGEEKVQIRRWPEIVLLVFALIVLVFIFAYFIAR